MVTDAPDIKNPPRQSMKNGSNSKERAPNKNPKPEEKATKNDNLNLSNSK
jgi:hypothetical protein